MSHSNDDVSNHVAIDVLEDVTILNCMARCEVDAVSDIVCQAIRRFRSAESAEDAVIRGAMLGVVRGAIGTHMDPRETAKGAIVGVLRAGEALACSVSAAFTDAAGALILETSALHGQSDETIRGILDAALDEGWDLGLNRQQVMSVIAIAILEASMESIQGPVRKGNASAEPHPHAEGGGGRAKHGRDVPA